MEFFRNFTNFASFYFFHQDEVASAPLVAATENAPAIRAMSASEIGDTGDAEMRTAPRILASSRPAAFSAIDGADFEHALPVDTAMPRSSKNFATICPAAATSFEICEFSFASNERCTVLHSLLAPCDRSGASEMRIDGCAFNITDPGGHALWIAAARSSIASRDLE